MEVLGKTGVDPIVVSKRVPEVREPTQKVGMRPPRCSGCGSSRMWVWDTPPNSGNGDSRVVSVGSPKRGLRVCSQYRDLWVDNG